MTFDRIITSKPVNRAAAMAVSGGISWQPEKVQGEHVFRSDAPPICQPYVGTVDLTGQRFGRFIVVGYAGKASGKKGGSRWFVRCSCGYHERRKSKVLRDGGCLASVMCDQCAHLEQVKAGEYLPKHLREPAA